MVANQKFYKGAIFRRLKSVGSGRNTSYAPNLPKDVEEALWRAVELGWARHFNDAPRGGALGYGFEILRFCTSNSIKRAIDAKKRALDKKLAQVLPAKKVGDDMRTMSDVGSFKIDGVLHSNFWGDGLNRVQICKVDFDAFKKAEILSRRQVYSPNDKMEIVKFDALKTINVSLSDVDDSAGVMTIDNVCGFAIWTRKLKIFTA